MSSTDKPGAAAAATSMPTPKSTPAVAIPPPTKFDPTSVSSWEDKYLNVDDVDKDITDLTEEELREKNFTLGHEEHHMYYNSTILQNEEVVQEYYKSLKNLPVNNMLSRSHRRAMVSKDQVDK